MIKSSKIHQVSVAESNQSTNLTPGQPEVVDKKVIRIKTGDGFVTLDVLQPEGKKRMKAEDFLRGNSI